jgi:hypothetical protein
MGLVEWEAGQLCWSPTIAGSIGNPFQVSESASLSQMESNTEVDWADLAHRTLAQVQAPYRTTVAGLFVIACELAVATTLVLILGCAISPNVRSRLFPQDLAAGKPWTVSNTDFGLPDHGNGPATKDSHFFHTASVDSPYVEIDLGEEHVIRSVRIENRADCCQVRALPLNVEIFDGKAWQLIAQRRAAFSTWTYDVDPVRTQRVRIRRPGTNFFHLKRISIYGQ